MADAPQEIVLGIGMAAHLDCERELVLRDFHPSGHAGFQLKVAVRDGIVTSADPRVGFMHRGAEKLFESRDYRQIMMLANRHDWLSAFTSELGVALTLESATGIVPPERATWIRMLLAEANRITAQLAFLLAVVDEQPPDGRALREQLVRLQEVVTGGRVHPMFCRIGGVAAPVDTATLDDYDRVADGLELGYARLREQVADYASGVAGIGVLPRDQAIGYGTSGVVARASGLDLDLRRDEPYLAYAEVVDLLSVPTRTAGDAQARYDVLVEQVPSSLAIMRACTSRLRSLGSGPIHVPLPKTVRAPESVTYTWIEGPLGVTGCLLASVGDSMPWRMKIRSASFANAQSMTVGLVGTPEDRLADAVMSFFFVVGDIDR